MASEEELLRRLTAHMREETTRIVGELRSLREAVIGAPALVDEIARLRRIEEAARGIAAVTSRSKPYYGSAIWALDQALSGEVETAQAQEADHADA